MKWIELRRGKKRDSTWLTEMIWTSKRMQQTTDFELCTIEANPVTTVTAVASVTESKRDVFEPLSVMGRCNATVNRDGLVTLSWTQVVDRPNLSGYVAFATREGCTRHAVSPKLPASSTCHQLTAAGLGGGGHFTFQIAPVYGNEIHSYGPLSVASAIIVVPGLSTEPTLSI